MIPKFLLARLARAEARLSPPTFALNQWEQRAAYWAEAAFGEAGLEAFMPLIRGGSWATVASWAYRCTSGVPPRAMEEELCRAENHWMEKSREASRPLTTYVRAWLETPQGQTRWIDEGYAWRGMGDGTLPHWAAKAQEALAKTWQLAIEGEPDDDDWWRAVAVLAYGRAGGWEQADPPLRTTLASLGDVGCDLIKEWLAWSTGPGCAARFTPGPMPEAPRPEETWAAELTQVLTQGEAEEED